MFSWCEKIKQVVVASLSLNWINILKPGIHLNNIYKFSSYLTENKMHVHHYKDQSFNAVSEILFVCCEDNTSGQDVDFPDVVRACGAYGSHCASKG
jgi:hypothetical protein